MPLPEFSHFKLIDFYFNEVEKLVIGRNMLKTLWSEPDKYV